MPLLTRWSRSSKKTKVRALPFHREGIGIEAVSGIGEHVPGRSRTGRRCARRPRSRRSASRRASAARSSTADRSPWRSTSPGRAGQRARDFVQRRRSPEQASCGTSRGASGQDRRQHGQRAHHDRVEPAAQASRDFRRWMAAVHHRAVDLIDDLDHRQSRRRESPPSAAPSPAMPVEAWTEIQFRRSNSDRAVRW